MASDQPILPLDRAAANRRRTRWLLAAFVLIALPTVFYVGQYVAFVFLLWMLPVFGPMGWVMFLLTDVLLVAALMVLAFVWLYRSATSRLLAAVGAQPLEENDEQEFVRAAQNMSIASGVPLPQLYIIRNHTPNLLAVGTSPANSALVATRGFLRLLERRELEGAVAHAFAQIGNGDTRLDTLLAAGVRWLRLPGTFVAWVCRGLGRLASQFGMLGWGCLVLTAAWLGIPMALAVVWGLTDPDFWWICWIALGFLVYVFAAGPALAAIVARAVARERKHLADAEAVQLTRYAVGLVRALAKVDGAGSVYAAPSESANLHFADPVDGGAGWWARVTDSHPSTASRLAVLSRLGGLTAPKEVDEASGLGRAWAEQPRDMEPAPALEAAPHRSPSLIRLREDVPLLASPRNGANTREMLSAGTRVTVLSEHEGFWEVVTPADAFGWISKLADADLQYLPAS